MSQAQLIAIAGSAIALLLSMASVLIIKWMDRVETAIKELSTKHTDRAVREAQLTGHIDSLQKCIAQTNKDVGVLSASVSKVWDVMLAQGLAGTRPSDKIVGTR